MATPVSTEKWAGSFDCSYCRRKRLMGEEFSKTALEKYRKQDGKLKCKKCVQQDQDNERKMASTRAAVATAANPDEKRHCAKCKSDLPVTSYNKNQWNKGIGKSKCRACVEKLLEEEQAQQGQKGQAELEAAREKVAEANKKGNPQHILAAESELSALEAQRVTGLKPVKMGRGRGRTSGRGRKNGR